MIEWLNANSGVVSGVAAVITGLATGAIAWFSWGTWRIFKKEEGRTEAQRQRISYTAAEIEVKSWSAQQILRLTATRLGLPIAIDEPFTNALKQMRESAQTSLDEYSALASPVADATLMAKLGNARLQARRILQLISHREEQTRLSEDDYSIFLEELAQWSSCLEALMLPALRNSTRRRKRDRKIPGPHG